MGHTSLQSRLDVKCLGALNRVQVMIIVKVEDDSYSSRAALFPGASADQQESRSFDGGTLVDLHVPGSGFGISEIYQFAVQFQDVGKDIAVGLAASLIYDGLKSTAKSLRVGRQKDVPVETAAIAEALLKESPPDH